MLRGMKILESKFTLPKLMLAANLRIPRLFKANAPKDLNGLMIGESSKPIYIITFSKFVWKLLIVKPLIYGE
jgi:hypothetical protein